MAGTAATACDGPLAPAAFRIVTSGYAERGGTMTVTLLDHGTVLAPALVRWAAAPASIARLSGDTLRFIDTGAVAVTAHTGDTAAAVALRIAAPPTVVFDLQDSTGNGNREVYRVDLDGQDLQRLTPGAGDNVQPTVAAGTVVFTSFRDGAADLWTVPLAGGTERRLAAPMPASQPALSPDGRRLAFIAPSGGVDHLWSAASDGSAAAPVSGSASFASAIQASPAWSRAGDSVAVVTTQFGNAAIVVIAGGGGAEVPLTTGASTDVDPAWSPDGHTLAFASTRDGDLGLFLLTVGTGTVRRLSPSPSTHAQPAWLPDGRIVYVAGSADSTRLEWIDPAHPGPGHVIPTLIAGTAPAHPRSVR